MKSFPILACLLFALAAKSSSIEPLPIRNHIAVNKILLVQLVNDVRKRGCQCGDTYYPSAPPIKWSNKLEQAALVHSNDMNLNNYFSHTANDGSKASERIDAAGYQWRAYGENIAYGYSTERDVVDGWVRSPGHCKNIMNRFFKEMGVARVGTYWTQVLALQLR